MSEQPPIADVHALARDIQDLRAGLAQLTAELGDLATVVLPPSESEASVVEAGTGGVYNSLNDWMDDYFLPTFRRRPTGDVRWCDAWTDHPEAVLRLSALWSAWEVLRQDPQLGLANWLTSYVDPQLAALLARNGPFSQCTPARHVPPEPRSSPWSAVPIAGPLPHDSSASRPR